MFQAYEERMRLKRKRERLKRKRERLKQEAIREGRRLALDLTRDYIRRQAIAEQAGEEFNEIPPWEMGEGVFATLPEFNLGFIFQSFVLALMVGTVLFISTFFFGVSIASHWPEFLVGYIVAMLITAHSFRVMGKIDGFYYEDHGKEE